MKIISKRTAMRSVLATVGFGLMTVFALVTAHADTVWTLSGVTFGSGGNVVGTFDTDAAGNLLSWDITTSPGGGDPGATYNMTTSGDFGSNATNVDVIQSNAPITNYNYLLYLSFVSPLVAANTPDQIVYAAEFPFFVGTPGQMREGFVGQAIAAETIPEPGSLGLLGVSILSLSIGRALVGPKGSVGSLNRDRGTARRSGRLGKDQVARSS